MRAFTQLLKASALVFLRSKQALFFTLFMPLVIMVIFSLIGFDKLQQYDVGLVLTTEAQPQTAAFVERLKGVQVLTVHEGAAADEREALADGDRVVVITLAGDAMESAAAGMPQELVVAVNESQPAQSQAILSMLNQSLDKASLALAGISPAFTLREESVDTRDLKYIDFLLPGLIAMSVMQMSVFSVAFMFVQYKEKGVLRRLAATPMRPLHFVGANALTRLAVSVVQAAIFVAVGVLLLKAHMFGSYLLLLLAVVLGALMFLGLGFTISGIAKTVESVPALANLLVFPMLFLGGVFFPISSMPDWLQHVAGILPLTFFSDALREVMTHDASLSAIGTDLLGMVAWGALLVGAATLTFGFQERE